MTKVTLSEPEHQQLIEVMQTTSDARLGMRCQAVLIAARGRPHRHMAEDLAIRVRTLQRWLHRCHQQGLDGLAIRWAPGRAAKIPESLAPEILGWVQQGPVGCGLDRANWTSAELAIYPHQVKGLTVNTTTTRTFCQRHGVCPYWPAYQDLKANPA